MAWTDPPTFADGATLTASQLNQYVRDNTNYLKAAADGLSFSAVRLTRSAATSIANATWEPVTWTTEVYDYGSWWSSGTDITTPAAAIPSGYTSIALLIQINASFAANATGYRGIRLTQGGSSVVAQTQPGFATDTAIIVGSGLITAVVSDVLTVELYQSSGGALDASSIQVNVARFAPVV